MDIICPYCNHIAVFESSAKIYRADYGMMYICSLYPECNAYVGVHKGTKKPLGRLANKELREWKRKAHAVFDPLWQRKIEKEKCEKFRARGKGYKWLAAQLNIEFKDCHIGMFDVDTCKRVVEICSKYNRKAS